MEKLKITSRHEAVLNAYKAEFSNHDALLAFAEQRDLTVTPEEFALLLCGWYEVEKEFKEGDWVVLKDGYVGEIEFINSQDNWANIGYSKETKERGVCLAKTYDLADIERHATPEEIAEEKERRFFARNGREPWQLKLGDILTKTIDGFPVIVSHHKKDLLYDFGIDGLRKQYRVACFVDDREDWEND